MERQETIIGREVLPGATSQDISLETREINEIEVKQGRKHKYYYVRCKDGSGFKLDKVNGNPKFLILYNGEPTATCTENYTPIRNEILEECAKKTLEKLVIEPKSWNDRVVKSYQWRLTSILKQDFEVPIGHLRQSEKFDWGFAITNSYDLTQGINVMLYIFRQICSNGLYSWATIDRKRFIHIEKENKQSVILEKVEQGIIDTIGHANDFFHQLDDMSKRTPSAEQALLVLKRLSIRKYEARILEDHGVRVEWAKSELEDVSLKSGMTEFDLLNAITAMSNDVTSTHRVFELQTGIVEKIVGARSP